MLVKAYPNPFNPTTTFIVNIPQSLSGDFVQLSIYDVQGRIVKTMLNKNLSAGNYLYKWDGKNDSGIPVSSGVYIANLHVNEQMSSVKVLLLK